jgi:hypothetical protein
MFARLGGAMRELGWTDEGCRGNRSIRAWTVAMRRSTSTLLGAHEEFVFLVGGVLGYRRQALWSWSYKVGIPVTQQYVFVDIRTKAFPRLLAVSP